MAEIDISYENITQAATVLTNAESDIAPRIQNMQTQVDNLLTPDGGLWMSQTSPAIQAQYDQFNSSAVQCCSAITSFANMFKSLVSNLQSMDQKMAYNITNPSSS